MRIGRRDRISGMGRMFSRETLIENILIDEHDQNQIGKEEELKP